MKLPTTKQGCVEKYNLRRQMYIPMTKLDMYLGGMICCSKEEFLYRNDYATEDVEMKDDIIINGKTYKHAYYVEDEIDYLITIYEYSDAFNYVEVSFNSLDLNDPLAQEFLNGLQIPKE